MNLKEIEKIYVKENKVVYIWENEGAGSTIEWQNGMFYQRNDYDSFLSSIGFKSLLEDTSCVGVFSLPPGTEEYEASVLQFLRENRDALEGKFGENWIEAGKMLVKKWMSNESIDEELMNADQRAFQEGKWAKEDGKQRKTPWTNEKHPLSVAWLRGYDSVKVGSESKSAKNESVFSEDMALAALISFFAVSTLLALPAAKSIAKVIQPLVDYVTSKKAKEANAPEGYAKKLETAEKMLKDVKDPAERAKLAAYIKNLKKVMNNIS